MAFSIQISSDILKVNKDWVKLLDFPKIAEEELTNTRARVGKNLESGKNAEDASLKAYSPSYIEAINKGQVKGKAPGATTPNLRQTGELLRSVNIKKLDTANLKGAEMFFAGGHKSGVQNSTLAQALIDKGFKDWFGFGPKDIKRIEERVSREVDKHLDKLLVQEKGR